MGSAYSSLRSVAGRLAFAAFLYLPSTVRLRAYKYVASGSVLTPWYYGPCVRRLPGGHFLKFRNMFERQRTIVNEAFVLRHIAKHGTPFLRRLVPRVVDFLEDTSTDGNDRSSYRFFCVLSERPGSIPGPPLRAMDEKSDAFKALVADFRRFFRDLRSLPPPPGRPVDSTVISSFNGAPVHDMRLRAGDLSGPFPDVESFHQYVVAGLLPEYREPVRRLAGPEWVKGCYRVVLTHSDLHLLNFLLDDDLRLSAVVDWESCAYLPEYWELTTSIYHHDRYAKWNDFMDQALPGYQAELGVEREMWKTIAQ